ncbi:MAG: hypothetical protein FWD61_11565 [Phycisphaerales bacterium]|nr:hypothetical protein [Phycisphaerales bacterium]
MKLKKDDVRYLVKRLQMDSRGRVHLRRRRFRESAFAVRIAEGCHAAGDKSVCVYSVVWDPTDGWQQNKDFYWTPPQEVHT